MERTRICQNIDFVAQEVQFMWHVLPGASTNDIKKHIRRYLNGLIPELMEDRIIFMSMFNDIEWTKKGNTETCFAQCQSGSICDPIQARTLVVLVARVRKYVMNGNSNELPKDNQTLSYCRRLTCSCVTLHIQDFQMLFRLGHCEERRKRLPLPRKILIKTKVASNLLLQLRSNLPVVWYRNFDSCTEKIGRRRGHRFRTRAIDMDWAKSAEHATISRRLVATTHWESRNAVSQSFRTGSICKNGGKWSTLITNDSVKDGNSFTLLCRAYQEPRNSQHSRLYKHFLTITSRSDQWLAMKYSILQELELWTTTRKFEVLGAYITRNWTIRTTIYSCGYWPQDFWGRVVTAVVELRATASTDARWTNRHREGTKVYQSQS